MFYPVGHVFPRSVPAYKPLFISGVLYASPLHFPVSDWGMDFDTGSPIRLFASQRTALTQAWVVSGDSMSPTINDGDIVLVEPGEAYSQHLPCAFYGPYGVMIKRRGVIGGRNCLLSDNPNVLPFFDLDEVLALGAVKYVYVGPRTVRGVS